MNIDSIIDNIKYSIVSSNNGKIEIADNSFLLNLLKEDPTEDENKKPFKVHKPWKCFKDYRFPVTFFILRIFFSVVTIFIWLLYATARTLRYLLFGKKHDKDLSLSPRFNFVLFVGFIISYLVIALYVLIFFLKSVLLFNPDSSVNEHGAIVIPQPCSIEHYVYLFNTAECWANTGIKVLEGDEVKIAASGSFYSSISQMYKSATNNDTLQYPRVVIASKDSADTNGSDLSMYKKEDARFGSLLLQIKEDYEESSFDSGNNENKDSGNKGKNDYREIIQLKCNPEDERGFETVEVASPGVLCFAVNDIYFSSRVIDSLKTHSAKQKRLGIDTVQLKKDCKAPLDSLDEQDFEKYHLKDMWFYDNVGEILLSITVTRNMISNRESTPSFIVKTYRWIESKALPLNSIEIAERFLIGILIILLWLTIDYMIGLKHKKEIIKDIGKKIKMRLNKLIFLLLLTSSIASAQTSQVHAYFTTKDMPDMVKFLPAPPVFSSPFFENDSIKYEWGKSMRLNAARAEIAKRDAVYGLNTIIKEFSGPFGLQISEEGTPEIYRLLQESLATCDSVCTLPKAHYMRTRPYAYFHEHTLVPEQEESHRQNGSYPSGHTILGWSAALLLMEINPEAQDTLLARGYMFGESRIIAGYHWASDVAAGRLAASAGYAKLHTSERFIKQMKRARREFKKKYKKLISSQNNLKK